MPPSGQNDRSLRERLPVPGTPPYRLPMAAPRTLLIGHPDDAERLALAGSGPDSHHANSLRAGSFRSKKTPDQRSPRISSWRMPVKKQTARSERSNPCDAFRRPSTSSSVNGSTSSSFSSFLKGRTSIRSLSFVGPRRLARRKIWQSTSRPILLRRVLRGFLFGVPLPSISSFQRLTSPSPISERSFFLISAFSM